MKTEPENTSTDERAQRPELEMLVGLPQSGKSTWARQQSAPIVSPDAIRLALHGQPFIPSAEPVVWATAKLMVRALFISGHQRVVLDATNITEKRRAEWYEPGWAIKFRVFNASPAVCIARALAAGREDLVPAIERMANNAEWPYAPASG